MVLLLYKWLFLGVASFIVPAITPANAPKKLHPFYVSVTEINHNKEEKALEISIKAFADDVEDVLKQNNKINVDLSNAQQNEQNNRLLKEYVIRHLALKADGKPAPLQYVGFEKDSESVYCYFEVPATPAVKQLDVTNSFLHDFTNQQINIMHVLVNGNRKSYKLDFPHKQARFTF